MVRDYWGRIFFIFSGVLCLTGMASGSWTFTDVNAPGGSSAPGIYNGGIDWRPQGDYALIAATDGLYCFEYATSALTYQAYPGCYLYRVAWSPSGTYAIITGGEHLYRYDHLPGGFGTLTEITDIESWGNMLTFYDLVWDPASADDFVYIAADESSGSGHRIVIFRYDPDGSPQVYADYSGGSTYVTSTAYAPVSLAFQADGDYFVIANSLANGYSNGIFVYDPDQSTFPKEASGAMQYYGYSGDIGNARTVLMSPVSGTRFVLLKGNGRVIRLTQQSTPATFVKDYPSAWHTSISGGDSDYSGDGHLAIFLERQQWTPNHQFMDYDAEGDVISTAVNIVGSGFTNQELRLSAVAWHPVQPMGLMAGEQRWIFKFSTDEIPGPLPTVTPTVTTTPTPIPVPALNAGSRLILYIFLGVVLMIFSRSTHGKKREQINMSGKRGGNDGS